MFHSLPLEIFLRSKFVTPWNRWQIHSLVIQSIQSATLLFDTRKFFNLTRFNSSPVFLLQYQSWLVPSNTQYKEIITSLCIYIYNSHSIFNQLSPSLHCCTSAVSVTHTSNRNQMREKYHVKCQQLFAIVFFRKHKFSVDRMSDAFSVQLVA